MKLIIAGSRHLHFGYSVMDFAIAGIPELQRMMQYYAGYDPKYKLTEVVSGHANGIDKMGEEWAKAPFWDLPGRTKPKLKIFEAEWEKYKGRAGPIRNNKMAVYADCLLLIWDGKSSGSQHMKNAMLKLKKPVYEVILRSTDG